MKSYEFGEMSVDVSFQCDVSAHSYTLGNIQKCHCKQMLFVYKTFSGTYQKCHCIQIVTVTSVTVSGDICIAYSQRRSVNEIFRPPLLPSFLLSILLCVCVRQFAAMVIDRFCLITFTAFTIITTIAVLLSAPHIIVA